MNDGEFVRWLAGRDPTADFAAAAREAERLAPTVIGLDVAAATALAQKRGVAVRIVKGQGAAQAVSRNLRPNRINIGVEQGRVVSAEVY